MPKFHPYYFPSNIYVLFYFELSLYEEALDARGNSKVVRLG